MSNNKDTLFFNVSLTDTLISALVRQRQMESFCDVQIKIGQRQFSLHSNVLAAVSPYFAAFLSQELPRGFSQLTPQVIEIQVVSDYVGYNDICEMAVEAVVDYMYTGIVRFHTDTIIHIVEIAKAMQLDELVKFCQDFISGNASTNIQFKTVLENEDGKEEIDQPSLKNEECLTNENCLADENSFVSYPKTIITSPGLELLTSSVDNLASIDLNGKNNDLFVETIKLDEAAIKSCSFVGVTNLSSCTNTEIQPLTLRVNQFPDSGNNTSVSVEETSVQNTLFNSNKPEEHQPPRQSTRHRRKTFKVSGSETGFVNKRSRHMLLDGDSISVRDNRFMGKNLQTISTAKIAVCVAEEGNGIVVKQNDFLESKTSCRAIKVSKSKCNETSDDLLNRLFPETKKFSCSLCTFKTSNVRRMSSHNKQHKHAKNTCYYCELKFKDKAQLELHAVIHSNQSMPFVCRTCNQHFQSNTQLLLHLPKHSDEKPYVCEVCRTGFKWKSALKNHMVTHADLKEHLCDVCGYTTAHRSQLKAHRLVHTGETMRCSYEGCDFHALKLQNLKYHLLTHTQEKAHQCEVCGQSFSLVKNMKRHMLLHMSKKNHTCTHCDFASTRFDKLKEHMHKQHNVGSAPEKRLRISDMVGKKSPSNETLEVNDAAVQETNPELEVLCDGDYHMVEFELSDGLAMIDGTQEMSYYCFQSISEHA